LGLLELQDGEVSATAASSAKITDLDNSQHIGVRQPILGRDLGSAQEVGLDALRKEGRAVCRILREQSGPTDLEEIRLKAREEWLAEYGRNKKK
jgi:hypothetical protein